MEGKNENYELRIKNEEWREAAVSRALPIFLILHSLREFLESLFDANVFFLQGLDDESVID